jgi:adenylylsulfate kinase-like enzyme
LSNIVWFTGLSGTGKSTLSLLLKKELKKKNYKCLLVDGDIFRKKTNQNSFLKKNIIKNNLKIISFCEKNKIKYDFILVSVISPFKKTRLFAQKLFNDSYYEIRTFSSLKVLEKRDVKGLYKLAKLGKLKNLIGYKSKIKYETSKHKYLRINTGKLDKKESIKRILKYLKLCFQK